MNTRRKTVKARSRTVASKLRHVTSTACVPFPLSFFFYLFFSHISTTLIYFKITDVICCCCCVHIILSSGFEHSHEFLSHSFIIPL